jgi:hypothetical protein
MAAGGEIWWPPVGRCDGRGWGDLVAASGEKRWPRVGPVEASTAPGGGQISAGAGLLSSLRAGFGRSVVASPEGGRLARTCSSSSACSAASRSWL